MKIIITLIFCLCTTIGTQAQEPSILLFENIWSLNEFTVNGTIVDWSFNSEMGTVGAGFDYDGSTSYYFHTGACNGINTILGAIDDVSFSTTTFTITSNECNLPETIAFETAYFEEFFKMNDPGQTFTYEINTTNPSFPDLIITNPNGDEAFYSGKSMLGIETVVIPAITIFPNPVKDNLNFTSTVLLKSMRIYDVQGREVYASTFQDNDARIDVSSIKAGVYFLIAENDTGQQLTAKFLKR